MYVVLKNLQKLNILQARPNMSLTSVVAYDGRIVNHSPHLQQRRVCVCNENLNYVYLQVTKNLFFVLIEKNVFTYSFASQTSLFVNYVIIIMRASEVANNMCSVFYAEITYKSVLLAVICVKEVFFVPFYYFIGYYSTQQPLWSFHLHSFLLRFQLFNI